MKKHLSLFMSFVLVGIMVSACSVSTASESVDNNVFEQLANKSTPPLIQDVEACLKIVATNSILADMTKNIVGDFAEVYSIIPVGIDPHEYEPLPQDIQATADADVIFYNALNLETGGNGWFAKLMESAEKIENVDYFAASKNIEPMYLTSSGKEEEQDPHAWLDIQNGIMYVQNIFAIVSQKDPKNENVYESNMQAYIEELTLLDTEAKEKFADIPEMSKLLVSSEGAFKYFSKAYGLTAAYIWEINTENQGTPEQMIGIIETIRKWAIQVLFVETSVDHRSMEQVSSETGLPIYATIFTDSIAEKNQPRDSYYSMMEWNLNKIHEGLSR